MNGTQKQMRAWYNELMFPLSLFSWWYGAGWRDQAKLCGARLSRVSDRFSIALLLRSLFSPFRQISAEGTRSAGLDAKVRAWLDKLISRCIGAMVRSAIIVVGGLWLFVEFIIGLLRLVVWPALPFFPVIGIILVMSGWVPWRI